MIEWFNKLFYKKVKIVRLSKDAKLPTYGTAGAACVDIYAAEDVLIGPEMTVAVKTGFSIQLPPSHEFAIQPRSGLSLNTGLRVSNSPGCVDEDFTGEVKVLMTNIFGGKSYQIRKGDRIAQGKIERVRRIKWVEVDTLATTERGHGGFGHTGR